MRPQKACRTSKESSRSTTGCVTCKIRKVKCDEGRPFCLRCRNRRLECPGYPTASWKWSSKHEVHNVGKVQQVLPPNYRSMAGPLTALRTIAAAPVPVRRDDGLTSVSTSTLEPTIPTAVPLDDTRRSTALDSLTVVDNPQSTSATVEQYPRHIEHALEGFPGDLIPTYTSTPSEQVHHLQPTESRSCEDHGVSHPRYYRTAADQDHTANGSAVVLAFDPDQFENLSTKSQPAEPLSMPFTSSSCSQRVNVGIFPMSSTLLHIPTLLVEYYFNKVCRECSTFDSPANPFRSKISEMQHMSAPVHYVIQSLAAAKLADDIPRMKVVGLEAQGKALQTLKAEFATVNALHNVSDEALYTLLLLGMTTSWHAREDIGLEYFHLARRIVKTKARTMQVARQSNLEFYEHALTYWTMITSMVSGEVEPSETPTSDSFTTIGPSPLPVVGRIMPHPWAGVSPRSLQLFAQVLQLIRKTRGELGSKVPPGYLQARIAHITDAIATAEKLEADCWSVSIPSIDHLEHTGDPFTLPLHYVLTAKAYLLSTLFHLYMIFPDTLEARIQSIVASGFALPALQDRLCSPDSAHMICQSNLWSERLPDDDQGAWLKDVGIRIVECLESIDSRSSTRVVHVPLLLSVANALTLTRVNEEEDDNQQHVHPLHHPSSPRLQHEVELEPCLTTEVSNIRIRQCRSFLINRLDTMHAAMRFHAIDNVLKVIKEIWRRSDAGQQDTFWMDVMSELNCETLFG